MKQWHALPWKQEFTSSRVTPCYHKVGCPSVLLSLDGVRPRLSIDTATCVACGLCVDACLFDAIKPIPVAAEEPSENNTAYAFSSKPFQVSSLNNFIRNEPIW